MVKNFLFVTVLLSFITLHSQPNTEVYLMDLEFSENGFHVSNFKNISNNEGYDNQPSFDQHGGLFYIRNHHHQTDISYYNLEDSTSSWFNNKTEEGSEYSPQKLPIGETVAAVRLDTNGLQRLYTYQKLKENPKMVFKELAVAYFYFYTNNTVVSAVLNGKNLDLVYSNLHEKTNDTLLVDVGRSIHGVPFAKYVSYTAINEEGNHDLYILDIDESLDSYFVCQLPIGIQDYTWLNETQILIGSRDKLFMYDTMENPEWKQLLDLSEYKIKDITRLAVSPDGKKLAIVAEPIVVNSKM